MTSSLFQTDWRLKGRLWDHLIGADLSFVRRFHPYSKSWDHEHCSFCFSVIGEAADDLHSGYCTSDAEISKEDWICEKCFADFAPLFGWTVKSYPALYGQKLTHREFSSAADTKKKERCVLCLSCIGGREDAHREGYFVQTTQGILWICRTCYDEYRVEYHWSEEKMSG